VTVTELPEEGFIREKQIEHFGDGHRISIDLLEIQVQDREREQKTVDAVEDAAVPGDQIRAFLDCCRAFKHRFRQVAELAEDADEE
jgi:hypothetical protein